MTMHPEATTSEPLFSGGWLAGFSPDSLQTCVNRAIELLRKHEPAEGYYLAFSGGKDSIVVKELARMAGVRFTANYSVTTIDPPELVRYIRREHPDAIWHQPKHGAMMHRVATAPKTPPTRMGRWCCQEYKEGGGAGCTKVFGVRKAESAKRAANWRDVIDLSGDTVICPAVDWTDAMVWDFIRGSGLAYCELYDEGWTRLGCVGCPLNWQSQAREFERWPRFRDNWHRAITANWTKWHAMPREDGKPRYQAKFKTADDFWHWWLDRKAPDYFETCQGELLWTNAPAEDCSANIPVTDAEPSTPANTRAHGPRSV